jgi:hypothetical protein
MKKVTVLTLIALALALPATANAWTYSLSGTAACNPQTGQYDVSWTIDNSSEPQTLSFSSRLGAGSASARGSATQSETVSGSTTSASLAVSGGWPSDLGPYSRSASVSLAGDCHAPVTPTVAPPIVAPPMGDDCSNLEGVQGSVPEGMIKDSEGNCVARQPATTEAQLISSPPAALAPTPVVAPPLSAPAIVATQGVASVTKTAVKAKTAVKRKAAPKAKKAKKKSAGAVKGATLRVLPRTR